MSEKHHNAYLIIKKVDEDLLKSPNDPELYYWKSAAYIELERYEDAISCANKGIKSNIDDPILYGIRGYSYLALKDYQAAKKSYQKAHELWPDHENYREMLEYIKKKEDSPQ